LVVNPSSISSWNTLIHAISVTARGGTHGVMGAENVRLAGFEPRATAAFDRRKVWNGRGRARMPDYVSGRRGEGFLFLAGFTACVPLANWMIGNLGTVCVPNGPCLIPVGPGGLSAPSGVLAIGVALVLRDLVQRRLGVGWAIAAILFGAILSAAVAPPALVVASAVAFLLSEAADLFVYTPLQRRGLMLAVIASSIVGLFVDSIAFLALAFGSLEYLPGQIAGKLWAVMAALPLIHIIRRRDKERGIAPA
jgi:queuosine precursor transporter